MSLNELELTQLYSRHAEDVKASPKLPPGSPYSPPEDKRGGRSDDAVFGESNYYDAPHRGGEDAKSDGGSEEVGFLQAVRRLYPSSAKNSSSHINYSYQDILRLGG